MSQRLDATQANDLVKQARAAIRSHLAGTQYVRPTEDWWSQRRATFVTLRRANGDLQGCIGSLEARQSLLDDLTHNAVNAAVNDPRMKPMKLEELDQMSVEVSLLGPLERIAFRDERTAIEALQPGRDGVLLTCGRHRGTFLPQMWEHFGSSEEFLRALKRKAGMSVDSWSTDVRLDRYSVEKYVDAP